MSGLTQLIREYAEHLNGRIGRSSLLYLFLDSAGKRRRLNNWKKETFPSRMDVTGRAYGLFAGSGMECFHPTKWTGVFPLLSNPGTWRDRFIVPQKDCKACEYHEVAKRRKRYASCRWFRDNNKLDSPQIVLAASFQKAADLARGLDV